MSEERNWEIRKAGYDSGFKYGTPIFCGEDLKEFEGLRIVSVDSNEADLEAVIYLANDMGDTRIALYLDNMVLDGESIRYIHLTNELVPLTESDAQAIKGMKLLYNYELHGDDDQVNGTKFVYCNSPELEGQEGFVTKSLCVFFDGRIMTEKNRQSTEEKVDA